MAPSGARLVLGVTPVQWQNAMRVALGIGILSSLGVAVIVHGVKRDTWRIAYAPDVVNGLQARPPPRAGCLHARAHGACMRPRSRARA